MLYSRKAKRIARMVHGSHVVIQRGYIVNTCPYQSNSSNCKNHVDAEHGWTRSD